VALKIHQNTFLARSAPRTPLGNSRHSLRLPSQLTTKTQLSTAFGAWVWRGKGVNAANVFL